MSRQLENGMKVFETDISNKVLLKNVVIALGTNTVSNYKELLDQYVEKLPKGRRLILVTPYDGRYANDQSSESVQTRLYELELAKKYDYITIADWYQVAIENPNIWVGTDSVHFNMETNGGEPGYVRQDPASRRSACSPPALPSYRLRCRRQS